MGVHLRSLKCSWQRYHYRANGDDYTQSSHMGRGQSSKPHPNLSIKKTPLTALFLFFGCAGFR